MWLFHKYLGVTGHMTKCSTATTVRCGRSSAPDAVGMRHWDTPPGQQGAPLTYHTQRSPLHQQQRKSIQGEGGRGLREITANNSMSVNDKQDLQAKQGGVGN